MKIEKYYEIEEIFEDVDELTIEMFKTHSFEIEDIENLRILKRNLLELVDEIDNKIEEVYNEIVEF